jgi:hypothetical protein
VTDQKLQSWFDADTVVMNPNIPIELFLPPVDFPDIHVIFSKDWNGLNNGVFPIRVHPWSVELLSAVIAYPHYFPDTQLVFRDQSALGKLLENDDYFRNSTIYAPLRTKVIFLFTSRERQDQTETIV